MFDILIVLVLFSIFLNTPIRPLQIKYVTAKWPLIGVEGAFLGEAGVGVGEKVEGVDG